MTNTTTFWLGTHETHWLETSPVELFISRNRFTRRKSLPRAARRWALDSGGFTELQQHGRWRIGPRQYADDVRGLPRLVVRRAPVGATAGLHHAQELRQLPTVRTPVA